MADKIKIGIEPVLLELLSKIENRKPLMTKIAGILLDEVHQNFEQQGNPAWRALSEKTIKDRRSKGYWPGKILQRTGQLLKSVTAKSTNDFAQVGTNKNYGAAHQLGALIIQAARQNIYVQSRYKRGKKKGKYKSGTEFGKGTEYKAQIIKVPQRQFLTISDATLSQIEDEIRIYLSS